MVASVEGLTNSIAASHSSAISISVGIEATEECTCALCHLPVRRPVSAVIQEETLDFCCYGCRHIYELVAPQLAEGMSLPKAMGEAGLDLNAPCCRGAIHGDPVEEARNTLARLMFNAFLAMMVMVLSLALYSNFFFAWDASGAGVRTILQLLAMLFATPAVLLLAVPIVEDAVLTFQVYRRLTTSALIAGGTLAAYGLSVYATFTGQGETYFETATMTLLLVTLGRWLDAKTEVEGNKAIDELLAQAPTEVSLLLQDDDSAGHQESRVPVAQIQVGDQIRVRPGENFAIDGQVLWGEGSVNEASITGEFTPAYKGPGDTVYAGTLNVDGSFGIEVTQVGEDRVMGKLVRLLDEARLYRAPVERLADRAAGYFVPLVIVLATATLLFWGWHAGLARGLLNSLSVLLIACPCALGVATPLTIWTALGRAAQRGILIRDSLALEKLAHLHHLFWDKTGTLTTGESKLSAIEVAPGATVRTEQLLQRVAALELASEHPLAQSIVQAAQNRSLRQLPVTNFQARPGLGITGTVNGQPITVGNWRIIEQAGLILRPELAAVRQVYEEDGLTVIHAGWDGKVQGLLILRETIRPSATAALAALQKQGLTTAVLTGDSHAAGAALGRTLDVVVHSELLPRDKVEQIVQTEVDRTTAMVGDGLNDAPALSRASVGIALGCGADVTREAADVNLLGTDLLQLPWLIRLARRTYRTIGWNLAWASVYNIIGIGLAMAGLLHPILAATAMVLSSALVVGNTLRLRKFEL